MTPRKATGTAAPDAGGPRHVDQAGQLIDTEATKQAISKATPRADAADAIAVYDDVQVGTIVERDRRHLK